MTKRKIIEIKRDLCNGCGLCTTACAEGALALDEDNKAVLVKEMYCDGLGACLDVCPTGALKIVERKSGVYDAAAAFRHVLKTRGPEAAEKVHGAKEEETAATGSAKSGAAARLSCMGGCPGSAAQEISREKQAPGSDRTVSGASELRQWPVQLQLVSPYAPYFREADLLIAADCTAFSLGSFHQDLLKGMMLVIACPKLDETEGYIDKLAEIIRENRLRSITVAIMTVPCCSGLCRLVEEAVRQAGSELPLQKRVVHIDGRVVS
jgi:Fe-S-cluster-containing hydrogenase component 2